MKPADRVRIMAEPGSQRPLPGPVRSLVVDIGAGRWESFFRRTPADLIRQSRSDQRRDRRAGAHRLLARGLPVGILSAFQAELHARRPRPPRSRSSSSPSRASVGMPRPRAALRFGYKTPIVIVHLCKTRGRIADRHRPGLVLGLAQGATSPVCRARVSSRSSARTSCGRPRQGAPGRARRDAARPAQRALPVITISGVPWASCWALGGGRAGGSESRASAALVTGGESATSSWCRTSCSCTRSSVCRETSWLTSATRGSTRASGTADGRGRRVHEGQPVSGRAIDESARRRASAAISHLKGRARRAGPVHPAEHAGGARRRRRAP